MSCDVGNTRENLDFIKSLREIDFEESFREVREFQNRRQLVEKARDVINVIMWHIAHTLGVPFESKEPGHGIGHMFRDFLNGSYAVYNDTNYDSRDLFIGLISGTLHDVGCLLVDRYYEKNMAIRHAEAGAVLVNEACKHGVPLNKHEINLVCYAIAAHTCYGQSFHVNLDNGDPVEVLPYEGYYKNGDPMYFVWITQWIDRLDGSGPGFVARHFLTLSDNHSDYDGSKFFQIRFAKHLRPLFRDDKSVSDKTMIEHVNFHAENQLDPSLYFNRVFCQGFFANLRDNQIARNREIVQVVLYPKELDMSKIEDEFLHFLCNQVEPSIIGIVTAQELMKRFVSELDQESRLAWNNGFLACMRTYKQWGGEIYKFSKELPKEFFWIGNLRSLDVL